MNSSFAVVGNQLHEIAKVLSHEEKDAVVVLTEHASHFDIQIVCLFGQILQLGRVNTKGTLAYLKKVFGNKRIERLRQHHDTKAIEDLKRFFVALGELSYIDLEELFCELKGQEKSVRFLQEGETAALRKEFEGANSLEACTNALLEKLVQILNPFQKIEDLFCNKVPQLQLPIYGASQKIRVLMYEKMRQIPSSESMWVMNMAKVLADLEMPKHALLRSPKGGFCEVHDVIRGAGAYKYALRVIGQAAAEEGHYLLYRGTRPLPCSTDWWKTIIEDFRLQIGSRGAVSTFDVTKALLSSAPFQGKKITSIGNSLGGVHAQYDALFHNIQRLITVASPGIDAKSADQFAKLAQTSTTTIEHYVEAEDIMDQFGEKRLGAGADPKKIAVSFHILEPGTRQADVTSALGKIAQVRKVLSKPLADLMRFSLCPKTVLALPKVVANFLQTVFQVHTRQTLWGPHSIISLTNQQDVALLQPILAHMSPLTDPKWEQLRQVVPTLLSKL